jgi:predicted MFS family arabinose efflux permease
VLTADAFATFKVLGRPRVPLGMAAALFFLGQFALFSCLRPFLETVTRVDTSALSALLRLLGVAGPVGTSLFGRSLQARLYAALVAMPLLAAGLIGFGSTLPGSPAFWGSGS